MGLIHIYEVIIYLFYDLYTNFIQFHSLISSLLSPVLGVLACSCALRACAVTWLCAYVLTSLKCLLASVLRACVLTRFCFWRAPVLACSRVYQAWFFYVLTCSYVLFSCWAQISYVPTCLRVSWTLFVLLCSPKILILKTPFYSEVFRMHLNISKRKKAPS